MVVCAIDFCPNSTFKTRSADPNIKYFSFPKNEELRQKWIRVCQRKKDWFPRHFPYLCSDHFLSTDFERDLKAELLRLPQKKTLKPDAVPSLYITKKEVKEREVNRRKQKFQEILQKHNDSSSEQNESFGDIIFSTFGIPKVLISSVIDETTAKSECQERFDSDEFLSFETPSQELSGNVFNLSELCRLCGTYSDSVKPIVDKSHLNFSGLIQKHFPSIKVSEDDVLSQVVCSRCENSLISWDQFSKMCNIVNQKFKLIVETLSNSKTEIINIPSDEWASDVGKEQTYEQEETDDHDGNDHISYVMKVVDNIKEEVSNSNSETVSLDSEDFWPKLSVSSNLKRRKYDSPLPICEICRKIFRCGYTKKIHMQTVHTDERPFLCNYCSARFKRKDHLKTHITQVHEDNDAVRGHRTERKSITTQHLCAECGKIFSSNTSYREHVNSVHKNEKKYHCDPCNISFNRYSKLYHHKVVLNHGKNQFLKVCEFCGLEFESEIYYIRHMAKHDEVLKCEKCCIEFNNNQEFKDHVSDVHFGKGEFACDICHKTFGSKTSLFQHKKAHENIEKPFQCEKCQWRFKNRGHLVVHMYRHTGERPYKCSICNKGFKQKGDMRKHKAMHILNERKCSTFPKINDSVDINVL